MDELETLVQELKSLKARAETARAEFFLKLMDTERDQKSVWATSGIRDWNQFLRSYHLCEPSLYAVFVRGVETIGADAALEHGYGFTMGIGYHASNVAEQIPSLLERSSDFREVEGTAPSELTVRSWARELGPANPSPGTRRKADELHRLRAENQALKAEIRAAKKRIRDLEQELEKAHAA